MRSGHDSPAIRRFAKGHGTGNDFVLLPDPDDTLRLTPELVARICDRRRGIGGDGVLRVVPAEPGSDAAWFLDYWNSDGSLAELCGNGVRVYARYLVDFGLDPGPTIRIQTRAGVVVAEVGSPDVAVTMPIPRLYPDSFALLGAEKFAGTKVTTGNPHLVCWVSELDSLDLTVPPTVDSAVFPDGANVEFIRPVSDLHVSMRVVERGSGETLSCGSGACAVAAVVLRDAGRTAGTATVDVPGGRLTVTLDPTRCVLAGPAVIVATGDYPVTA